MSSRASELFGMVELTFPAEDRAQCVVRLGEEKFRFCFELVDRCPFAGHDWRAYIEPVDYRGRNTNPVVTHRHIDERGVYICWSDVIRERAELVALAAVWSVCTALYIRCETPLDTSFPIVADYVGR